MRRHVLPWLVFTRHSKRRENDTAMRIVQATRPNETAKRRLRNRHDRHSSSSNPYSAPPRLFSSALIAARARVSISLDNSEMSFCEKREGA